MPSSSRDDIMVLEDDKHLQVNYFCSTVVRKDAMENIWVWRML